MNSVANAGFLDGTTGAGSAAAGLTVDEAVVGAPGRIVLVGSSNGAGGMVITAGGFVATPGQPFEAFVRTGSAGPAGEVYAVLQTFNAQGVPTGSVELPITSPGDGRPRRGLPGSFDGRYVRGLIPGAGTARLYLSAPTSAAGGKLYMLKPYVGLNPGPQRARWSPGSHLNPDLQLREWPAILPAFNGPSVQVTPIPLRKEFAGDTPGMPVTRRIGRTQAVRFEADFTLSLEQRDALEVFQRDAGAERFWFLRPDTQELCYAKWAAEGDPADTGQTAGGRTTKIALYLTVS